MSFVLAHDAGLIAPQHLWHSWAWEPLPLTGLVITAGVYAFGVYRLWGATGAGRGLAHWRAACFAAGLLAVALALCSPLDPLAETLFTAHMIQHLLLMLVAPPLRVLGALSYVALWTVSPMMRRSLGRWWNRHPLVRRLLNVPFRPLVAWVASVVALLLWHVPVLYQAALTSEVIHAVEHLRFLVTGFLFWWVLLRPDRHGRMHPGVSLLYVFTASLPGGLLGALLTFAGHLIYPLQSTAARLWGLTPLEDQQLAGLSMWVPGRLVYLVVIVLFAVTWCQAENRLRSTPMAQDSR